MPRHRPRYLGPTDDPDRDASNWLDDEMERCKSLPVCYGCGDPITGDYTYLVSDHRYCEDCWEELVDALAERCRVRTENFTEE